MNIDFEMFSSRFQLVKDSIDYFRFGSILKQIIKLILSLIIEINVEIYYCDLSIDENPYKTVKKQYQGLRVNIKIWRAMSLLIDGVTNLPTKSVLRAGDFGSRDICINEYDGLEIDRRRSWSLISIIENYNRFRKSHISCLNNWCKFAKKVVVRKQSMTIISRTIYLFLLNSRIIEWIVKDAPDIDSG